MSIHLNNFKNNLKLQLDNNPQLNGLDAFKKNLEKEYFSKVTIRNCSPSENFEHLVIEMNCNLELIEVLFHSQKGTWGSVFMHSGYQSLSTSFSEAFESLQDLNDCSLDIEEFSLILNDSSIIIKKIYHQSIQEQFGNLLNTIAENYVHITNGLTETPYEIYIPVFEENIDQPKNASSEKPKENANNSDYYTFWGLYFDSEEDAVIYDLSNKSIISGDLQMLNH